MMSFRVIGRFQVDYSVSWSLREKIHPMGSVSFHCNFFKSFIVAGEKNIPWVNVKLFNITQVSRLQTSIRVNNILLDWWAGYNSIISGCHLCLLSCYLKKCLQLPLRYLECFFLIEVSNGYIHT